MLKIKNSAEFVRQLLKTTSIQYRIFPERKKWTGWWELAPRPQLISSFLNHLSNSYTESRSFSTVTH